MYNGHLRSAHASYLHLPFNYYDAFRGLWVPPKPNEFFDVTYRIPKELTRGKQFVTVRFQAPPDGKAGGVSESAFIASHIEFMTDQQKAGK
jgi:hypothetical protein